MSNEIQFGDITHGEWGKELIDIDQEMSSAKAVSFYVEPPITVVEYSAHMEDDYNGEAIVVLSNGDKIEYKCKETSGPGTHGPDCSVQVCLNDELVEDEFDLGNYSKGAWVDTLVFWYTQNYHTLKK